ncbi:hypothetical protein PCE1_002185 [Barthelona sp. PCE]
MVLHHLFIRLGGRPNIYSDEEVPPLQVRYSNSSVNNDDLIFTLISHRLPGHIPLEYNVKYPENICKTQPVYNWYCIPVYLEEGFDFIIKVTANDESKAMLSHFIETDFPTFGDCRGCIRRPLLTTMALPSVVGILTLSYFVAKPFQFPNFSFLTASEALVKMHKSMLSRIELFQKNPYLRPLTRHPFLSPRMLIGHRGSGNSSRHTNHRTPFAENTVLSFDMARKSGANWIEFDVQPTKDDAIVIFHDYFIQMSNGHNVPVCSLTRKQFIDRFDAKINLLKRISSSPDLKENIEEEDNNSLNVPSQMPKKGRMRTSSFHKSISFNDFGEFAQVSEHLQSKARHTLDETETKNRPFVLSDRALELSQLFKHFTNTGFGFNIELKYPVEREVKSGLGSYPARNDFADMVLENVFNHNVNNPIYFSTFDPELAVLLKIKQPFFPVLLLSECEGEFYDERRNSTFASLQWAITNNLDGVVLHSDVLLKQEDRDAIIETAKSNGLFLVTFGSDNNIERTIMEQYELGVDALIADNIRQLKITTSLGY